MMNSLSKSPALIKREMLEHRNLWRVPLVLIAIAALLKLSMLIGNLSLQIDLPPEARLDETIDTAMSLVVARALGGMNFIIMVVMFLVAIFYALSCLYGERQDNSILFWRSLPVSDSLTVASKLLVALVMIPLIVIVSQVIVSVIFSGADTLEYLGNYFPRSLVLMGKIVLWSLVPTVAWCMFCSEISSRNPFLLAFIAPLLAILIDKLFLDGTISQTFVINRLTGISSFTTITLVTGLIFSAACIALAIIRRSQRI